MIGLLSEIDHLMRIASEIVEFLGGAWAEPEVPVALILRVVSVLNEEGFGGARVNIGVGHAGVVGELVEIERFVFGEFELVAHGFALGFEIDDVEEVGGADGTHGIREFERAGSLDMDLTTDEGPGAQGGVVA